MKEFTSAILQLTPYIQTVCKQERLSAVTQFLSALVHYNSIKDKAIHSEGELASIKKVILMIENIDPDKIGEPIKEKN